MKGFEYLLVYSCLHYPLFENEEVLYIFFFLRPNVSPISTIKEGCKSGVVSLAEQKFMMRTLLIHLVVTVRPFINYNGR